MRISNYLALENSNVTAAYEMRIAHIIMYHIETLRRRRACSVHGTVLIPLSPLLFHLQVWEETVLGPTYSHRLGLNISFLNPLHTPTCVSNFLGFWRQIRGVWKPVALYPGHSQILSGSHHYWINSGSGLGMNLRNERTLGCHIPSTVMASLVPGLGMRSEGTPSP